MAEISTKIYLNIHQKYPPSIQANSLNIHKNIRCTISATRGSMYIVSHIASCYGLLLLIMLSYVIICVHLSIAICHPPTSHISTLHTSHITHTSCLLRLCRNITDASTWCARDASRFEPNIDVSNENTRSRVPSKEGQVIFFHP